MRRSRSKAALLLAAAALWGSSGCTIINDIRGSEKRDVYKFDHPFTTDSASFQRSTEALGKSAVKSIHIANAYFLPDAQVRKALVEAVQRGVDVQVMVPGPHIDIPMVRSASWLHYGELLKGGVQIFEYEPTMMHNKTVVIDGIYSIVGSINFDARSMNRNAEEALAFYDRESRVAWRTCSNDKERCKEISWEQWDKRGFHRRMTERLFWIWEPYYHSHYVCS